MGRAMSGFFGELMDSIWKDKAMRRTRQPYTTCPRCLDFVPARWDDFEPDPVPLRHDCGTKREATHEHDWRLFGSRWECLTCDANSDEEAGVR